MPYEFSTSISIMMAMITNSDMTRIIGRKWVVIPYRKDRSGEKEKIVKVPEILCLKSYGTFPVTYQQAVSRWIIENIFEDEKDNWKVYEYSKDYDTHMALETKILVESHDGGGYYSYLSSKPDRLNVKIYMDNSSYILIPKSLAPLEVPEGRVTFYGLDEDEEVCYHDLEDSNEEEDYDDDEHWECAIMILIAKTVSMSLQCSILCLIVILKESGSRNIRSLSIWSIRITEVIKKLETSLV